MEGEKGVCKRKTKPKAKEKRPDILFGLLAGRNKRWFIITVGDCNKFKCEHTSYMHTQYVLYIYIEVYKGSRESTGHSSRTAAGIPNAGHAEFSKNDQDRRRRRGLVVCCFTEQESRLCVFLLNKRVQRARPTEVERAQVQTQTFFFLCVAL